MRRLRLVTLLLLAGAAAGQDPASQPHPGHPPPARFDGLERLYFQRLDDLASVAGPCADAIAARLPAELDAGPQPEAPDETVDFDPCEELAVRDFVVPLPGPPVVLRELVDLSHPRIHDQYWCLYSSARRGDCWFFSPTPARTEGKLLAALRLEDLTAPAPNVLRLRARGTMVRPMGAWWTRGVVLEFAVTERQLLYRHVLVAFTVIQPYDRVTSRGAPGEAGEAEFDVAVEPPMVAHEELEEGGVVRRVVDAATDAHLAACGVNDLREVTGTFARWHSLAACITSRGDAVRTTRRLDEPAFIERGGSPN